MYHNHLMMWFSWYSVWDVWTTFGFGNTSAKCGAASAKCGANSKSASANCGKNGSIINEMHTYKLQIVSV